ncbi:MAG: ribosome silencing factor [Alphaproteobacteria bacterium]|nr:ribosome silencing factor [Alphaproteobacteria bacterium]
MRADPASALRLVVESLEADKAENVVAIDLAGKSAIADYMIVATGRSQRQIGAITEHVVQRLKSIGQGVRTEGLRQCDWVLIDAGDVIVHLFRPDIRSFYNLEKMWSADLSERQRAVQ